MKSPENSYIQNIDKKSSPNSIPQLGLQAENVVIDFLRENFPNIKVRPATKDEDSGVKQIEKGKQIDAVAYIEEKPVMVMQITTARDSKIRGEKRTQMYDNPFVHLNEMKPQEGSIPKVLVYVDSKQAESFLNDHDFSNHIKILEDITRGIVNSLNFDLIMTKNPAEQDKVKILLDIFQMKRADQN